MPRLPTIRVMGSQFISTMSVFSWVIGVMSALLGSGVGRGPVAGAQAMVALTPEGLPVRLPLGEAAKGLDGASVGPDGVGREARTGGRVHEGHELVGEVGHGAADADAAHVGAAADAGHPAPLGDVAVDHRPPAAELDQALVPAVL